MPARRLQIFDENNPRYLIGCCYIKTALLAVGTIQLVFFFCNLTTVATYRWQHYGTANGGAKIRQYTTTTGYDFEGGLLTDQRKFDVNNNHSELANEKVHNQQVHLQRAKDSNDQQIRSLSNKHDDLWANVVYVENQMSLASGSGNGVSNPNGDLAWNSLLALCVVLSFYALRFVRPYLLAPKLVLDGASAGLSAVQAATLVIFALGASPRHFAYSGAWIRALMATCLATIYIYIFGVSMRCFKYLMEKRAWLDRPSSVDIVVHWPDLVGQHHPAGHGGMSDFIDIPPAYPGSPTVIAANGNNPEHQQHEKYGIAGSAVSLKLVDECCEPPTYEEAAQKACRQQQQQQTTAAAASASAKCQSTPPPADIVMAINEKFDGIVIDEKERDNTTPTVDAIVVEKQHETMLVDDEKRFEITPTDQQLIVSMSIEDQSCETTPTNDNNEQSK